MEVVCIAFVPVLGAIAWAVWLLVRVSRRDEAALCAKALARAVPLARQIRVTVGEAPRGEAWRAMLAPSMPDHLLLRLDLDALDQALAADSADAGESC